MPHPRASRLDRVPRATLDWLLEPENPAVAVLTRRGLLGESSDGAEAAALWAKRNEYAPVSAIVEAMRPDGSWDVPSRDYQKYRGSLWQIHLLGELWADGTDPRVSPAIEYAFSRQLADGSWSVSNMKASGSVPCLTANVGRALARLGYARDERVAAALAYLVRLREETGAIACKQLWGVTLNGYCHMLTPKLLLFLAETPRDVWPDGAEALRDECIAKLREKRVLSSLPAEAREFSDLVWTSAPQQREGLRERYLAEHGELHYGEKPGWKRFGYPLSYNSDALEALFALSLHAEPRRPEYEDAIALVESAGGESMRWKLRTTLNGKMYADVEKKGAPSKWLTLRALTVLKTFESL
jgi:hypothetical protein